MRVTLFASHILYYNGETKYSKLINYILDHGNDFIPGLIPDDVHQRPLTETFPIIIDALRANSNSSEFVHECFKALLPDIIAGLSDPSNGIGEVGNITLTNFRDLDADKLFDWETLEINEDYLEEYIKSHPDKNEALYSQNDQDDRLSFLDRTTQNILWDVDCCYFDTLKVDDPELYIAIKDSCYELLEGALNNTGFTAVREHAKECSWKGQVSNEMNHTYADHISQVTIKHCLDHEKQYLTTVLDLQGV